MNVWRVGMKAAAGAALAAMLSLVGCGDGGTGTDVGSETDSARLEVRFLGVGGFLLRFGGDSIITPPLYSNPGLLAVTAGTAKANKKRIEAFSADVPLAGVKGILVGHAHYDHLMDVPYLWPKTDNAQIFGNRTMRHLLAAYAPDRQPQCASAKPTDVHIPRDRVVQLDDPLGIEGRNYVDYRMCPEQWPGYGDIAGDWVHIEGTNVRFSALCSEHPNQLGPIHFGEGSIGADVCSPPSTAAAWLEGATIAYLIDFLDPETDEPLYRLYYQDAPTNAPIGQVSPDLLGEKRVDVAMLCVGSYPQVNDAPGDILRALTPRYAIGGHWEDFFTPQDQPIRPLRFHDMEKYRTRALAALGDESQPDVIVDGQPEHARFWRPNPGTTFGISPAEE